MLTVIKSGEARLVETLNGIQDQRQSWTAILFHLNNLLPEYKSDYQVKIAVNLIAELLEEYEGGIYVFSDGAIAVLCNYLNPMLLGKLLFQMRYLYMDDPLAYTDDGQETPDFCAVYRLKDSWQECLDFCTRRMTQIGRGKAVEAIKKTPSVLNPATLVTIERDLATLDVSDALRRQPVCAVMPSGAIRRVFDELYLHIAHLRELLKAEIDFLSNRWLFQYFTHHLDERVLALLAANSAQRIAQPVSININIETLLSTPFANFDTSLKPEQKVSVVFEVGVMDVFADMAAFAFARDAVQKKGYRICIDGVTAQSFPHVHRERLKADLIKLQWNADTPRELANPENKELADSVKAAGSGRVILCRCDDAAAVEYGQALGVSLFQGRYLDGLLVPHAKVVN